MHSHFIDNIFILFFLVTILRINSQDCGPKINLVVMSKWEDGEERRVGRYLMGWPRDSLTHV